jgi:pilus assembly protein CpaE
VSALARSMPQTGPLGQAAEREPFTAFAADEVTREALARAADAVGLEPAAVVRAGPGEAQAALAGVPTPELLVVDLDAAEDVLGEATRLAEVCDPGTKVILLARVNDIATFRALVDLGVRDYLVKPVSLDVLENALERAMAPAPAPAAAAPATMPEETVTVAVVGTQGGAGASTVAANLAWLLATAEGRRTVLIDLDLVFGTQALAFDAEPSRGLIDAFAAPERVDPLFVRRALTTVGERLSLMAGEAEPSAVPPVGAEALEAMLGILRQEFDAIVLDMPRTLAVAEPEVFAGTNRLLLVSPPSLAGMRDTLRLKRHLSSREGAAVELVLNRVGGTAKGELARDAFEEGAETKAAFVLPEDGKATAAAVVAGKPLAQASPRAKVATVLRTMAASLVPDREAAAAPLWRRLLGRGGR